MSQIVHSLDLRMNEPVSNNFLIIWLKIARHTSRIWPLVKFALEKSFLPLNENHIVNWTLPRELYPPTSRCFQLWQTRYTHHRIFSRHCFRRGRGERGRTSNKHFSPQRPILPFLLAPISSSTSSLLKDPLYIYISSLDSIPPFTRFSRCSPFRLSLCDIHRYPDIPSSRYPFVSGLFIHWNDFLQQLLHGIRIILVLSLREIDLSKW